MHELYKNVLADYSFDFRLIEPLKTQLKYTFDYLHENKGEGRKDLLISLNKVEAKLKKIRERFGLGNINQEIYSELNEKFQAEKSELNRQLENGDFKISNLENYINFSVKFCSNINKIWELNDYETKQKLQHLIFPQGIIYERANHTYRTEKINEVFLYISNLTTVLEQKKGGLSNKKLEKSASVAGARLERTTFGL